MRKRKKNKYSYNKNAGKYLKRENLSAFFLLSHSGDEAVILEVEGIAEFEKITSSELKEREISYKYCKVE